jgi:hypothetical protein
MAQAEEMLGILSQVPGIAEPLNITFWSTENDAPNGTPIVYPAADPKIYVISLGSGGIQANVAELYARYGNGNGTWTTNPAVFGGASATNPVFMLTPVPSPVVIPPPSAPAPPAPGQVQVQSMFGPLNVPASSVPTLTAQQITSLSVTIRALLNTSTDPQDLAVLAVLGVYGL